MTRSSIAPIPKVSFLYCNFNAAKLLDQALSSVMDAASFTDYEIIVVDDVSTDESVQMVKSRFPSVHLIVNTETLWSEASFNRAIQAARGEYVHFLGTDTIVYKGTLEKLLSFMDQNQGVHAATCKVFFPDGRFQQNACRDHGLKNAFLNFTFLGHLFPGWKQRAHEQFTYRGWDWEKNQEVEASGFTNLMVRRSVLNAVGLLDTGFKQYFSENDLCLRIRKNGGKVYYLAEGKVVHHLRGTVSKSNISQIAMNYEQDCFYYFKKYYGFWTAAVLKFFIAVTNLLLTLKKGKPTRIFSTFLVNPDA